MMGSQTMWTWGPGGDTLIPPTQTRAKALQLLQDLPEASRSLPH